QADRVDVPDTRRRRVVADARRIARQGDDVADAERVRADQFRLQCHEVLVARGEVDQRVDANLLPDHDGQRECTHANAGHGAVPDVDGIRAGIFGELRAGDALRGIETAR